MVPVFNPFILNYFIFDSYLILEGYEYKNLSFQRRYAPFAFGSTVFTQLSLAVSHLGLLSTASTLAARTTSWYRLILQRLLQRLLNMGKAETYRWCLVKHPT